MSIKSGALAILTFHLLMIVASGANGAILFVSTSDDIVADDHLCSLREALMAIDAGADNDCANESGDPYGTNDWVGFESALIGSTIVLTEGELPTIASPMMIIGPVAEDATGLTIDGNGLSRLLRIASAGDVGLRNLRLVNGSTEELGGGAIRSTSTQLTLVHVEVADNVTVGSVGGGGIHAHRGRLIVQNSIVRNNSTSGSNASGGGIHTSDVKLIIRDSLIEGNQVLGASSRGGGISASEVVIGESEVLILDSRITGNATWGNFGSGGGVRVIGGTLAIHRSLIDGNSAASDGGGIKLSAGQAELVNLTISGNTTTGGSGGGIHANAGGSLVLIHSTVALNIGPNFGGQIKTLGVDLELHNSLIVKAAEIAACSTNAGLVATGSLATEGSCGTTVVTPSAIDLQALADGVHTFGWQSAAYEFAGDCQADFGVTLDQLGQPRPGLDSTACDAGAWEAQSLTAPDHIFTDRFELIPGQI